MSFSTVNTLGWLLIKIENHAYSILMYSNNLLLMYIYILVYC
jgi:hypothetical protein